MLFQPSARTGFVFLVLVLSQSTESLAMCLAGALGSTLCAYVLERPGKAYFDGEGGFNGGLLGLALSVFYEPGIALPLAFAGGALTGLVRVALNRVLPVPSFTAPFVLVGWLIFMLDGFLGLVPGGPQPSAEHPAYALLTNASQVLFLLDHRVGALVFVAVLLHSRTAALWVLLASAAAWLATDMFDMPAGMTAAGLLGYNGMILAAALQQRGTPVLLATGGVFLTVVLSWLAFDAGLTPLSAPFVLSAWLVIGVETILARRSRAGM